MADNSRRLGSSPGLGGEGLPKENIVPFLDHAAKRANDALIERVKGAVANEDRGGSDGNNPNI